MSKISPCFLSLLILFHLLCLVNSQIRNPVCKLKDDKIAISIYSEARGVSSFLLYLKYKTTNLNGFYAMGYSSNKTLSNSHLFLKTSSNTANYYIGDESGNLIKQNTLPPNVTISEEALALVPLFLESRFVVLINNVQLVQHFKNITENGQLIILQSTSSGNNLTLGNVLYFDLKQQIPSCPTFYNPALISGAFFFVGFFPIIFGIIVFILLLINRNHQPLLSRGLIPYFGVVAFIGAIFPETLQNIIFSYELLSGYGCFFNELTSIGFSLLGIFLLPLNSFRYILIVNINKRKNVFYEEMRDGQPVTTLGKPVRFLKRIAEPWFYALSVGVFLIMHIFIFFLFFIITTDSKVSCSSIVKSGFTYYVVPVVVIVLIGLVLTVIFDYVSNFRDLIKCQLGKFFLRDDPFRFRFEIILLISVGILYIIAQIINSLNTNFFTLPALNYVYLTLIEIVIWLVFLDQTCFSLFLTIIERIKRLIKKTGYADNIEELLANPEYHKMFLEFSKKEWSFENILIWDDIMKYKKITGLKNQQLKAIEIVEKYLKGNESKLEVNIDKKTCDQVRDAIKNTKIDNNLFVRVEAAVKVNLTDIYGRFRMMDEYIQKRTNDIIKDTMLSGGGQKDVAKKVGEL